MISSGKEVLQTLVEGAVDLVKSDFGIAMATAALNTVAETIESSGIRRGIQEITELPPPPVGDNQSSVLSKAAGMGMLLLGQVGSSLTIATSAGNQALDGLSQRLDGARTEIEGQSFN